MAFSLKAALSPTRSKIRELQGRTRELETRNAGLRLLIQTEMTLEAEQLHDLEELQADIYDTAQHNQSIALQKQALAGELAQATADLQAAMEAVQAEERQGSEELLVAKHREEMEKMVLQRLSKAHTEDIAVLKGRFNAVSKRITALQAELAAAKAAKQPLMHWIASTLGGIQQEALQELQSLAKEIS